MSIEMPIIRLELQAMKNTVMHHLGGMHTEIEKYVDAEIDKAICAFDFEGIVREVIKQQLRKTIESYFEYGQGRQDLEDAVSKAFKIKETNP